MRGEFGDAVSRQGPARDEVIDAVMDYGQRRQAGAARAVHDEELLRAILAGGGVAAAGQIGHRR